MGLLDSLKFKMWDDVGTIITLLKKWKPRQCETEKDYENSLFHYLNKELGEIQITKQYAQGRFKADLVIGKRVIVEMKNNLNSTAKYQRLIGQLTQYSDWDGSIVVILTGDSDINIVKDLKTFLKKHDSNAFDPLSGEKFTLFEK